MAKHDNTAALYAGAAPQQSRYDHEVHRGLDHAFAMFDARALPRLVGRWQRVLLLYGQSWPEHATQNTRCVYGRKLLFLVLVVAMMIFALACRNFII